MTPSSTAASQDLPLRRSYAEVLQRIDPSERTRAAALPFRIGITAHPDGGWEDYTRLELLYDMPLLVARDLSTRPSDEHLARFRFAHHCVGFCGLVRDRVADRQVAQDADLMTTYSALESVAREAIREALGTLEAKHVRRARRRWVTGVARESRALTSGVLDPVAYASVVFQKTSWLACITLEMMDRHDATHRVEDFQNLMGAVILGLQARDDALDAAEDIDLHGCSFPQALAVDPLTLGTFAQRLLQSAVGMADELGFSAVSQWLETNQTPSLIAHLPGESLLAPLGAFMFAHKLGEVWRGGRRLGLMRQPCGLSGGGTGDAYAPGPYQ